MIFRLLIVLALTSTAVTARAQTAAQFTNNSMDGQFVWFQQGVFPRSLGNGLPAPGVATEVDGQSTLLLQPYTANNVLLVGPEIPGNTALNVGTMVLQTPAMAESLQIADSTGFGPTNIQVDVHFANDTPTDSLYFVSGDWGSGPGTIIFRGHGRIGVNQSIGQLSSYGGIETGPVIFGTTLDLGLATPEPVSSLDFFYLGTTSRENAPFHNMAVFSIGASATSTGPYSAVNLTPDSFDADIVVEVPEPRQLLSGLACGAIALIRRRKQ